MVTPLPRERRANANRPRRNYATAAVIGCQRLSGFFSGYDLGEKAIWTLAAMAASKTGKVARRLFAACPNLRLPRLGSVELEFLVEQSQVVFTSVLQLLGKYTMDVKQVLSRNVLGKMKSRAN